jgi:cysteine-rich repeat protein
VSPTCSDGTLDPGESCDDGNQVGGDGCEADCSVSEGIAEVHAGQTHTCARVWEGTFKCWGEAADGRLGYGNGTNGAANVGDDETPSTVSTIELGEPVRQLCTGDAHSCAVLESGAVRCWGRGANGRLGNAQNQSFGDGEPAIESPLVDLGGDAVMVACGGLHSCAIRADGAVLCWGESDNGRLGLGPGTQDVGDDEAVSSVGPVDVGGATVQLALGLAHSCARLETGVVRCWGTGARGRLGYGDTNDVGANETPSTAGNVPLGEAAVEIVAGAQHTCARLQSGLVKCWGANDSGQLGDGTTDDRGDDRMEVPSMLPPVVTGDAVVTLSAGDAHTCAVLANGNVTCWGEGGSGQLASEDTDDRLQPDLLGVAVDPQRAATAVTAGGSHTCARVTDGSVRCWGAAAVGQLGYGTTDALGDEPGETPDLIGPVPL